MAYFLDTTMLTEGKQRAGRQVLCDVAVLRNTKGSRVLSLLQEEVRQTVLRRCDEVQILSAERLYAIRGGKGR